MTVFATAHLRHVARAAAGDRPWSPEAVSALGEHVERVAAAIAARAAHHADHAERRTVREEDVALATRPPKREELHAYVDQLKTAIETLLQEAREAGVRLMPPTFRNVPIREAA